MPLRFTIKVFRKIKYPLWRWGLQQKCLEMFLERLKSLLESIVWCLSKHSEIWSMFMCELFFHRNNLKISKFYDNSKYKRIYLKLKFSNLFFFEWLEGKLDRIFIMESGGEESINLRLRWLWICDCKSQCQLIMTWEKKRKGQSIKWYKAKANRK